MLLITIKLVFKKGFWDGLQYFDFFEAFPSVCRHLWSIGGRSRDGLLGGAKKKCPIRLRFLAIDGMASGMPT